MQRFAILGAMSTCLLGCYSGAQTSRDINASWQQRKVSEIRAEWKAPTRTEAKGDGTLQTWSIRHRHIALPTVRASLDIRPDRLDAYAEAKPGETWTTSTDVRVHADGAGRILSVEGPSLRWGPPNNANLRWGTIMGLHLGMGRLDDTATPLPSGGMYIGGMLSKRMGLVGNYSFTSGSDDAGGAIGMAWAMGLQWWPQTRVSLRAGPAMVLAFNPGFEDAGLEPGLNGSASYALVKAGSFVLDVRLDVTGGTSTRFANLGVGINLN